jgi:hypothetical protein
MLLRRKMLRYNQNEQALWARNATAVACTGPVRRLLGRYRLTGRFFLMLIDVYRQSGGMVGPFKKELHVIC